MRMSESARWEHFPHGADVGIRGVGPTHAEAFAQAALAMTAVVTPPEEVAARDEVGVECEADTLEDLFFDWIDALVFEMSTRRMLFSRFEVDIDGSRLSARIWGEPVDRARHEPTVEIKGPTYTELRVAHPADGDGWVAQCVVDV
jgi:tRNA nucleotidyltransferase (CCA-adding enzyme)